MAKSTSRPDNPIEKLLQERTQYMSWLARLDTAGDAVPTVPENVRLRIRADYETRLKAVVEELRSHAASIDEQLEEFRARRSELTSRESQAKETLSEGEVRHAVGEYDEGKWQTIRGETTRILVTVREELTKTNGEIDRLTEVQALIAAPTPRPAAAPPPPPPAPAYTPEPHRPAASRTSEPLEEVPFLQLEPDFTKRSAAPAPSHAPAPPPAAPAPAAAAAPVPELPLIIPPDVTNPSQLPITGKAAPKPAPKKEEPPGRAQWIPSGKVMDPGTTKVDELAFLKSVSSEPRTPAPAQPPRRGSGGFSKPAEPAPPPPPPTPSGPVLTTADPFAIKSQPAGPDPKSRASQANAPKTLKCGDCGTLNRPTEWYCERCGAELAAL